MKMTKNERTTNDERRNALCHVLWAKAKEICDDKVSVRGGGGVEEGQLLQSSSHAAASRPVIAKCFITKF